MTLKSNTDFDIRGAVDRMEKMKKDQLAIASWLHGREYYVALDALTLGLSKHKGVRKDGVTPEFQHQLDQISYARTLTSSLLYPQETFATILLHDIVEDTDVTSHYIFSTFGEKIGTAVELMTNVVNGVEKENSAYYGAMMTDPIASFSKGCDRSHNVQTMVGVFSYEKQITYIETTEKYILPMLKVARRNFPFQLSAYINVKTMMERQIELIEAIHDAAGYNTKAVEHE
jgi:(p)ppGpp synthase/HD superfamily hydrolase